MQLNTPQKYIINIGKNNLKQNELIMKLDTVSQIYSMDTYNGIIAQFSIGV